MNDRLLAINDLLLECAGGEYQWALLSGQQAWSGSDLAGAANQWGGVYKQSRDHLLDRIRKALSRRGWRADLGYVLMGSPARWHVRLVLIDSDLRRYDQVTGARLGLAELPSGLAERRSGYELEEAA